MHRPPADLLHVIVPYSNPLRWHSREKLFLDCIRGLLGTKGVHLTVVIQDHGNACHDLELPGVTVVKVHGKTLLWSKECLINAGVARLPSGWKYMAWIDGDIIFENPNWALETIHYLGHFPVLQPWQTAIDLGPHGEVLKIDNSFAYQWTHEPHTCHKMGHQGYKLAHPGYAWAMTKHAFETVGGLIDHAILGAADHHMALALIGKVDYSLKRGTHENYNAPIRQWERLAAKLGRKLYYVPCTIRHPWHGSKKSRRYVERWQILLKHNYNPVTDVRYNAHGVLEFAGNKPEFERDVWNYHVLRNEDANVAVE